MNTNIVSARKHKLPSLPYSYDGLEPVISEETLTSHHRNHHQQYITSLNKAEQHLFEARKNKAFDRITYWKKEVAFNTFYHILHSIYFANMTTPLQGGEIGIMTKHEIRKQFGTLNHFKEEFKHAAKALKSSGWCTLIWNNAFNRLELLQFESHENNTQIGGIPILVCDVFEHAYYLDFQSERGEYINSWWDLINWFDVEERIRKAMKGQLTLTYDLL